MRPRLPLADAAALRGASRRTALLRSGLAAAVLVLVAAAFAAAPAGGAAGAASGPRRGTVVVLDVSGSIDDRDAAEIQRTLADLVGRAGPGGRIGLVLFSDTALEALPPTAPASALQAYRRFYVPLGPRRRGGSLRYAPSPWEATFSGGTSISRGLHEARVDLRRAGMRGGRVYLLSDLVDSPEDDPALRRELRAYASDPALDLRVRALASGMHQPLAEYRRVLGAAAVGHARGGPPAAVQAAPAARFPFWLAGAAAAAALLLAANELLSVPLGWRPAPREAAP